MHVTFELHGPTDYFQYFGLKNIKSKPYTEKIASLLGILLNIQIIENSQP